MNAIAISCDTKVKILLRSSVIIYISESIHQRCSIKRGVLYLTDSCEGRLSKERQYFFFDIRVVNKIVELKYKGIIVRIIAP